jgi:hypothetical protein
MHRLSVSILLISLFAASVTLPAARGTAGDLPAEAVGVATERVFSDAQLLRVGGWIRERAPECPNDVVSTAAQHFLEELRSRQPEKLDQILAADFPLGDFESVLLRHVAARLTAPEQLRQREDLANRRVQLLLARNFGPSAVSIQDAQVSIVKIRGISQVYYRRLLEGRIDDEDLIPMLKRGREPGVASGQIAGLSRQLTAGEIASEFARKNQKGSALERLSAHSIEARLKTAGGTEQHLMIFRLRPNRFRLHVIEGATTKYILAFSGTVFWSQTPERAPQYVRADSIGSRRYLTEFINPLFATEGYTLERLEDGTVGGRKVYRIQVVRSDRSRYIASLDTESLHQLACEFDDGTRIEYSDFRDVAGITIAFRELTTDKQGRSGLLEITRFTANPGLVGDFFEPVAQRSPTYFALERALADSGKSFDTRAP